MCIYVSAHDFLCYSCRPNWKHSVTPVAMHSGEKKVSYTNLRFITERTKRVIRNWNGQAPGRQPTKQQYVDVVTQNPVSNPQLCWFSNAIWPKTLQSVSRAQCTFINLTSDIRTPIYKINILLCCSIFSRVPIFFFQNVLRANFIITRFFL